MKLLSKHINIGKFIFESFLTLIPFYFAFSLGVKTVDSGMTDYCIIPHNIATVAPPLVLFVSGRDHRLFYEAYNDASDLNDDGILDTTYDHSIDYYGYFDPYKCYEYRSTGTRGFYPVSTTADKFCSSNLWSGNLLNWLTMSRIDVLRKVLYGGYRITDTANSTVLERAYIPQDAHSWGKEFTGRLCFDGERYTKMCALNSECQSGSECVDKSVELIGMASPPGVCNAAESFDYSSGVILVVKYSHSEQNPNQCGDDHTKLLASYEPGKYQSHYYVGDFGDSSLDPSKDNSPSYSNFFVVADFQVDKAGTWEFAIDGNEGVELEIQSSPGTPGQVVASFYGCHSSCNCKDHKGSIELTTNKWYRLIARHTERTGKDGVRVWYKKPGSSNWILFGNSLNIRAPNIGADNTCALTAFSFIQTGTPGTGTVQSGPITRHLFCNTTLGDGPSYPPIMRMLKDKTNRIWEWVSKERPVCDTSLGTPTDYEIRVEVCNPNKGLEQNCKYYPSSGGIYKPIGLLQKYGEGDGSKVCSKTMTKPCNTDSDCNITTEGLCIENSKMYFGLITGSYEKNLSGGVLRKNIWTILDETNAQTGIFQTSESTQGNIIKTFDNLKIVGFRYSDYSYQGSAGGTCGWITSHPLQEGECKNWGNPVAEMMYEGLRYFAGKGSPTSDFIYTEGGSTDASLGLKLKSWGIKKGSSVYQPYDIYPACSKPFLLVLSDVNLSYDSDKLPGSKFGLFSGDLPGLDVGEKASFIGEKENIHQNNYFLGKSGNNYDFVCSSKAVADLGEVQGLCPEEPTKQGSYYAAAVSYYGKSGFSSATGKPEVNTFSVALASPVADLRIKVGNNFVSLVPFGKSVSGCLEVYSNCANKCTLQTSSKGIVITNCQANAFCPTNQIVDYYVDTIVYDSEKNVTYAKFRVNFEDVEQGADHDMDAIVEYEICTGDSCDPAIPAGQVKIKLTSLYAAGCIDQVLGFVISGTTEDGAYLPVRDKDSSSPDGDTPGVVANLPLSWEKVFTVTGSSAGFLKDPLWYASKWGGFQDSNGNGYPDLPYEWDRFDNSTGEPIPDGIPDTYFKVVNPLKMEQQLERAFSEILRRVASGTAASVLSSSEGTGANLLQALFYPKRTFNDVEIDWTGEVQNLWYYIDPNIQTSSIRDDYSNGSQDWKLILTQDRTINFYFDYTESKTKVRRYRDSNGDGLADEYENTIDIDELTSLWKAGKKLHSRDLNSDPRTIYTTIDGSNFLEFKTENASTLKTYLNLSTESDAYNIIRYIHGFDMPGFRNRTVTYQGVTNTWKLGDIVSSTPKIQSSVSLSSYHMEPPRGYSDASYYQFINSKTYKNRGVAYIGANDGMLHAFRQGTLDVTVSGAKAQLCQENISQADGECDTSDTETQDLGREIWAYIPKNGLPYLKYLADPNYCHLFYVDLPVYIFDASINRPMDCGETDDANCEKKVQLLGDNSIYPEYTSWRTILIGGMGLGGACKNVDSSCTDCVKTPVNNLGFSSYFAIDVTDPYSPKLMWEFSHPELGYSTSGPAIVRVGDPKKNGKWFVVFASGPTGPIDAYEFKGRSSQNLKLFVLDLKTGNLLRTIDSGIANAFGGSLINSTLDEDRSYPLRPGFYKDDVFYLGFTKKDTTSNTWTKGGVIRVFTKESPDPNDWVLSKVIDDIGPVTAAVTKLQDIKSKKLWLYFGEGRYYYKADDPSNQRSIYGVMEQHYTTNNTLDYTISTSVITKSDLKNQTTEPSQSLGGDKKGWFIELDAESEGRSSERLITDPLASPAGLIYFITFKPVADVCSMGGETFLWIVNYSTGGVPNPNQLLGKGLLQVSTGAIEEIDLSSLPERGGRRTSAFTGIPPRGQGLSVIVRPQPLEKTMHLKRR